MKTMKNRVVLGLLTVCLLITFGCKTDQAGVTNRVGTIKATLAAAPPAVTEAAEEVLEDMDLVIISASATKIDGRVIARTAQDVKVRVDSQKIGDDVSEVFIRIGGLGDSELSLTILDEIKEELGIATDDDDDDDDDEHEDDDDDEDEHEDDDDDDDDADK